MSSVFLIQIFKYRVFPSYVKNSNCDSFIQSVFTECLEHGT